MRIKALQLTSHSAFQSTSDRVSHRQLGASSELRRRCGSQLSARSVERREAKVVGWSAPSVQQHSHCCRWS